MFDNKLENTKLFDVKVITPFFKNDLRGEITKVFSREVLTEYNINFIPVETLIIESKKNVLRGLHFQSVKPQTKLISCIRGKVWCVVVDIRKDSNTIGKWGYEILSEKNKKVLYIPEGFALGTYALSEVELLCINNEQFIAEYDSGIKWNDPILNIQWPHKENIIISEKDERLQSFSEYQKL